MSAYQCWLDQKERLRETLHASAMHENAALLTRHTLAQVEQNALAEQSDDLLRQQMGILFSCFKTSLNLLDISVTTKVWQARSLAKKPEKRPASWWLLLACAVQLAAGLIAYFQGRLLLWVPIAASLILTVVGWITLRRAPKEDLMSEDRFKVTASPDTDKLFQAIDAQMKAIDRYMNDFTYLNEQNALRASSPDPHSITALAELLEALYECEGDEGGEAMAAAQNLLRASGIRALPYAPEDARHFNILPSVSQTRTLVPALVAQKDGALLYRGTAAVLENAIAGEASVPSPALRP
jgi:hypothetical protein